VAELRVRGLDGDHDVCVPSRQTTTGRAGYRDADRGRRAPRSTRTVSGLGSRAMGRVIADDREVEPCLLDERDVAHQLRRTCLLALTVYPISIIAALRSARGPASRR
jgi:hypothetical protein